MYEFARYGLSKFELLNTKSEDASPTGNDPPIFVSSVSSSTTTTLFLFLSCIVYLELD